MPGIDGCLRGLSMEIDMGGYTMRPWRAGNEEALARYANNRKVWINLRDSFPHPYTVEDAIAWVQLQKDKEPAQNFAIATADEVIGGIGIKMQEDVHRGSAEIGYWLGRTFLGPGNHHQSTAGVDRVRFC